MSFSPLAISRTIAGQFGGCQDCSSDIESPLHVAAFAGDADVLRDILMQDSSRETINQRNHLGCTPLRLAATGGHTDCVKLLLDHGASTDIPDVKGQTSLQVAVKNLHFGCAEVLLQRGANPNGDANSCSSPLSLAAMQGNCQLVQLLLDYEAEIVLQRQGASGMYFTVDPLHLAAVYHHYDCLKLLLAAGGQSPLYTSSFYGPASLSCYHTLVLHRCSWHYAELFDAFGADYWVKDSRGRYPWETEPRRRGQDDDQDVLRQLVDFLMKIKGEPRSLKSCCRLAVWKQIVSSKKKVSALRNLQGVPQSIIQYLSFEQI